MNVFLTHLIQRLSMSIRSFLGLLFLLWTSPCFSQIYVDDIAIDTAKTPFCQLVCTNAGVLNRARIILDYGQRFVDTGLNRQRVAGPDKKPITFNSPIDALNFMVQNGWILLSSQVTSNESGSASTYVYLLQRRKTEE